MQRLVFSRFVVDEGNRQAFERCSDVARCDPLAPMPLMLYSEPGCGKTHLLRSIIHQVRASSSDTGIAYVAPGHFPDEVRNLIKDPTPVDMATHAILLVDDLDRFDRDLADLEAIVRLFLENDHYVVCATDVHPARLSRLSDEFRRFVTTGSVVELHSGAHQDAETDAIIESQRCEIEDLKTRIEAVAPVGTPLPARDDALRTLVEDLTQELAGARETISQAKEEIEHLHGENALLEVARREVGPLRERIKALQEERDGDAGGDKPQADEREREKLEHAHPGAQMVREEARGMLKRAQALLAEMQENRSHFAREQDEQQLQWKEIAKLESTFARTVSGEETPPVGDEDPVASAQAEERARALKQERDQLMAEVAQLQESIVRAHSERDTAKVLLDRLRNELDETRRDLVKTREEAASPAESERLEIAALEKALAEAQTESTELRRAEQTTVEELLALQSQLTDGTDVLERLMVLFGVPTEGADEEKPEQDDASRPEPSVLEPADEIDEAEDNGAGSDVDTHGTIYRADFGDGTREPSPQRSSLHHVEEIRPGFGGFVSVDETEEDDEGEADLPQSRRRSAS